MADEEERQAPSVFVIAIILFFVFRPEEGYIRRLEFIKFLIDNGLLLENFFLSEIYYEFVLFPLLISLYIYRTRIDSAINKFMHSLTTREIMEEYDKDGDDKLSKKESQGFFDIVMDDFDENTRNNFDSDALFDKYDSDKDGNLDGDELSALILELYGYDREQSLEDFPVSVWDSKNDAQEIVDWYNSKSGENRSVDDILEECSISSFDSKSDARVLLAFVKELLKGSKLESQHSSLESSNIEESASEDEMQKLDRLYNEGYLSKERYDRLKQDLSR